ncbi:MAG: CoA-transferase [Chloroflexi bacterium]|nr:CoA-transferase [Chloroflexota bacterium]
MPDYTPQELMVIAAAREVRDGEVVFVGMRLPLLAFALAKRTHAPNAAGLFENGILRDRPIDELLMTMSDPPNVSGASWCTSLLNVMALLHRGSADLGFIGGAEVDRFGNVNSSYVGNSRAPRVKLPGSGGACDIASHAGRFIAIIEHDRRRLPERVSYVTSPGYGSGGDWRRRVGLRGGGPSAVITTLGVLGFDAETKEAELRSIHPGVALDDVRANTGWPLRVSGSLAPTPPPTREELEIVRALDKDGIWTR